MPPPYELATVRLARELALPMEAVKQDLDTLEREGVPAIDRPDWLRAMQGRRASLIDVLEAVRKGLTPWDWEDLP